MAEQDIVDLTRDVVADGRLDEKGVQTILEAARRRSEETPLTAKERGEVMGVVRDRMRGLSFSELPTPLRVLSIMLMVASLLGIGAAVMALLPMVNSGFLEQELGKIVPGIHNIVAIDELRRLSCFRLSCFRKEA